MKIGNVWLGIVKTTPNGKVNVLTECHRKLKYSPEEKERERDKATRETEKKISVYI